ncbi:fimbrial protein [Morganella morganii subsp. morganii]|uniref:fimbrial protein n=1 Tax=Morganella morganii TaxID=582 RepID=UPI00066661C8|nr:fimbrial protein [Morganella morganii]SSN06700.1 putative minor fimbrial subunit StfF [Klebsiella pneumoniae]EJD6110299.1 fimbrial protein [Morganella morganii]EJG2207777.1 fimbrial protein [Morganella morganii]EKU4016527.1 fimbrial protein [Morganella morganii]ELA7700445.1 fimbrial protein [Morganella morganii]
MKTKKNMLLMLFAMMVTLSSQAEQKGDTRPYTMTGILRAMTICHVNNDQIITADFKNVGINKLETEVYRLPLNYTLDCPGIKPANTLRMTFMASRPSASDPSSIESDVSGLLVRILKDGQPLELNKFFKIDDAAQPPKLEAQLVKVPGIDLIQSPFRATGTLVAEYL